MLLDVPLAYLTLVPLREKGPDAAAACGVVKRRGSGCREEKGEEEKKEEEGEVLQRESEQNWVKTQ